MIDKFSPFREINQSFFCAAQKRVEGNLCGRIWLVVKNAFAVLLYFASCCLVDWRVKFPLFSGREGFHSFAEGDDLAQEVEAALEGISGADRWRKEVVDRLEEAREGDRSIEWRVSFDSHSSSLILSLYLPLDRDVKKLDSFDWEEASVVVDPETKKKINCYQTIICFKV